jgi:hypothetical protein
LFLLTNLGIISAMEHTASELDEHSRTKTGPSVMRGKGSKSDLTVQSLIASNLVVVIWALIEKWPIFAIMWIYWIQSASIGIFWFIKMISLKKFTTKGFYSGNQPVKQTEGAKIFTSIFFLIHYGGFHVAYASFLAGTDKSVEPVPIILAGAIFFVNQLFSFFYNMKREREERPNLGKLMFFPYARIVPMHVTVMVASILRDKETNLAGGITLVVFLLLKTVADVVMYIQQLRGFSDWPSRKLDDAGPLVQLLTGKDRVRKYAEKIYVQMKDAYAGKHEYKIVEAKHFPHLYLKYYTRTAEDLKAKGFAILGDIEDTTLSQLLPQFRTFVRYLVNKDGTIAAGIYYIFSTGCPKILHIANSALSSKIVELQTEFSNGCFVVTTNATETLSTTPRILVKYVPPDTSVDDLLEIHNKRLKEYAAEKPELCPVCIHSPEEAINSVNRQNMIFSAYGKSIPTILWEINKIAENNFQGISMEHIVYEMRKLRDSEGHHKGHR